MNLNKTKGIIIRKIPYQEQSEILTVVCEDKIHTMIGKGIKKITSKNKAACELGSYVELEYIQGKSMDILKSANLINSPLLKSYEELLVVQLICELAYRLEFDRFEIFQHLQTLPTYHGLLYFLYHLCKENGLLLEVNHCVRTMQKKNIIALSLKDGGFVCKKAHQFEDIPLTKNEYIVLSVLARVNATTFDKYQQLHVDYSLCKIYLTLLHQQLNVYSRMQIFIEEEIQDGKSI